MPSPGRQPDRPSGPYTVTLYGSGNPSPEVIELAEQVGHGIGARGWVLRNGGYGGTMEAAARGARAAGGKVVGVTCRAFARPGANAFVTEIIDTSDLFERLARLIEGADAFAAFPGGTGTLTEVFLTWELMVKGFLAPRPFCLAGRGWERWWSLMLEDSELIAHLRLLRTARDAGETLAALGPR